MNARKQEVDIETRLERILCVNAETKDFFLVLTPDNMETPMQAQIKGSGWSRGGGTHVGFNHFDDEEDAGY